MIIKITSYDEDSNDFICSVAPHFRNERKIDPFIGLGLPNGNTIEESREIGRACVGKLYEIPDDCLESSAIDRCWLPGEGQFREVSSVSEIPKPTRKKVRR